MSIFDRFIARHIKVGAMGEKAAVKLFKSRNAIILARNWRNTSSHDGKGELDIVLLDGHEVDLGELVREAVVLDMDTKHLCSENCEGLCSGCGVNLNHEACRCKPEVDPRLASLAKLLEDKD